MSDDTFAGAAMRRLRELERENKRLQRELERTQRLLDMERRKDHRTWPPVWPPPPRMVWRCEVPS